MEGTLPIILRMLIFEMWDFIEEALLFLCVRAVAVCTVSCVQALVSFSEVNFNEP